MKYYEPEEATITVEQVWKVQIMARRYANQVLAEIKGKLEPERHRLWKASNRQYNGYDASLISFSIDSALDSAPGFAYPDW